MVEEISIPIDAHIIFSNLTIGGSCCKEDDGMPDEIIPLEVTATEFAKMSGCTKSNVTQWINDGKLTEGVSWRRDGPGKIINVEKAKFELLTKLNPRQVKNKNLFAFLGIDADSGTDERQTQVSEVDEMNLYQVRAESEREQLKILTIQRLALEGKYWAKEDVERNMEAAALTIKTVFEGLASRSIAEIRNAPTDRDAENIMRDHIEKALEQVEPALVKDLTKE